MLLILFVFELASGHELVSPKVSEQRRGPYFAQETLCVMVVMPSSKRVNLCHFNGLAGLVSEGPGGIRHA